MNLNRPNVTLSIAVIVLAVVSGCKQNSQPTTGGSAATNTNDSEVSSPAAPANDSQEHPDEGPHHGELIELGDEDYHAELLHDDDSVTIYVLDGTAMKTVAIASSEIFINVVHSELPEQFTLTSSPDNGEPEGKSSRFTITSGELVSRLEEEGAEAKLVLTINGMSYRGEIAHDHSGHAGHKH